MVEIKKISSAFLFFVTALCANAQYTETINTNNPGRSQGAFSVGTGVVQLESSLFYRAEEHVPTFT